MALVDLLQAARTDALSPSPATTESFDGDDTGPLSSVRNDPRAQRILAKTIYRELRQSGMSEADIMSLAGEMLNLVADGMNARRR